MQKKNLFLSIAAGVVMAAAAAYTAKLAAGEIKKNGGVKPTLDKARDGATSMVNAAKQHPAVTKTAGVIGALRGRLAGGTNDNFVGEVADEGQRAVG